MPEFGRDLSRFDWASYQDWSGFQWSNFPSRRTSRPASPFANQNTQDAFRFYKKWGPIPTKVRHRFARNKAQVGKRTFGATAQTMRGVLAFDAIFAVADITGSAFRQGGRWAAQTGRREGLIGGAAYGATRAFGANVSATVGTVAGTVAGSAAGAIFGPAGATVGGAVGGIAGAFIGYGVGQAGIEDYAQNVGRFFMEAGATGISQNKLNFGGDFRDSQGAYTMRQLAVQEMAGSLLNARQTLGSEARYFHR